MLDAPAHLSRPRQIPQAGIGGQDGQPVVGGFGFTGWPFGDQAALGQAAVGGTGMSRLAGRTSNAINRERSAAVSLSEHVQFQPPFLAVPRIVGDLASSPARTNLLSLRRAISDSRRAALRLCFPGAAARCVVNHRFPAIRAGRF